MPPRLPIVLGMFAAGLGLALAASPGPVPAQDGYAAQIRDRTEWWRRNHPALVPEPVPTASTQPGPAQPGTPLPGGGKSVALCIGLNSVNPARYAGWSGHLGGCEADANDMVRVATSQGFAVTRLLTREATLARVKQEMGRLAGELNAGDILMVSYSGHGGQARDRNGDEEDRLDETWCLYDGQIVDDEIALLMAQFRSGVRVLVFSDSCHSGSVTRAREVGNIVRSIGLTTPGTRSADTQTFRQHNEQFLADIEAGGTPQQLSRHVSPYRVMPETVRQAIEADPVLFAEYDARTRSLPARSESENEVRAAVLLISGCQDDQLSADIGSNGLFTATFKRIWGSGGFSGSYRQLREAIAQRMPAHQQPQLYTYGPGVTEFANQRPFAR
jgi:hypothetical protein